MASLGLNSIHPSAEESDWNQPKKNQGNKNATNINSQVKETTQEDRIVYISTKVKL